MFVQGIPRLPAHLRNDILRWNLCRLPANRVGEFPGDGIADITQPTPRGLLGTTTNLQ